MNTDLAHIQNLGLAVIGEKPRLQSAFPENAGQIINAVELESKGAHMVITSHYHSLPFVSKPEDYWTNRTQSMEIEGRKMNFTKFQFDYLGWNAMIGLRNLPDELVLNDVILCLKSDFGIHNEESIRTAIKLNLRGDFGEVIEAYGQFNRIYLTKIMVGYEKKLKSDHKRAIELRDKLKAPIELTDEEKEAKLIDSIKDVFSEFKKIGNTQSVDLISCAIYDYLDKKKIIQLTPDEKNSLMQLAAVDVAVIKGKGISVAEVLKDEYKPDRISMSKRLAVRNYFNTIQKLEI